MIYILYGLNEFLINKEIDKIISKNKIDDYSISNYNLETNYLKEVIEDAETISMFSNNKCIICDNSFFLTGKDKKILGNDIEILEKYLSNINESSIIIFKVLNEKLDERKKIVKELKQKGKIIECNNIDNPNKYVKNLFEDYKISDSLIKFLIDRVGSDFLLLEKEIEKLKIYKFNEKEITKEDILNLTIKTIDLNIFNFIDNIIYKRKEEAYATYEEMKKLNEEPIAIIVMLANQFRIMYQSKELMKRGYSEKDIAKELDIHPFRVKKALEKSYKYSSEILFEYLKKLGKIDYKIKSGQIYKYLALEIFILGM